jgi:acetolactate synthase-1/2/3 large subunit
MKGDRAGNLAVQCADVILSLGCSMHVLTTGYDLNKFAPHAYKIQIDLDANILRREQVGVNEKIECGVQTFLDGFLRRWRALSASFDNAQKPPESEWTNRCRLWKRELSVDNEPHKHPDEKTNYYDFVRVLSESCKSSEIITTDAGSAYYVIGQAFRVKKSQRVINSGSLGAMGHALPFAIGAGFAEPGEQIVCVTGDGSFQTNIQELATIKHHHLNVAVFVVNNGGYISIRNTQKSFFNGLYVGTGPKDGVSFPDLKHIAKAYGLPYLKAAKREELEKTVRAALRMNGPVLCEIVASSDQEIIPTVSSVKLEDGSMESKPLHDMYPFLPPEKLKEYMAFEEPLQRSE